MRHRHIMGLRTGKSNSESACATGGAKGIGAAPWKFPAGTGSLFGPNPLEYGTLIGYIQKLQDMFAGWQKVKKIHLSKGRKRMVELILFMSGAVFFSFLCSLFEAALYSVPVGHIESLAKSGSTSGRLLKKFRENVDAPIAGILSLNTIAHTVGAALAGAAAANVLGTAWLPHFSAVFTLIVLLFSEIIPKTIGVVYARNLVTWIAYPIQILIWVQWPLIWLCQLVTRLISGGKVEHVVSSEELIALVHMGRHAGTIGVEEGGAIQNILLLKEKTVRQIMTPRTVIYSLQSRQTIGDVLQKGVPSYSRIPVVDEENAEDVVGIVHRRNILAEAAKGRENLPIQNLAHPPHFVAETLTLDRVLRMFLERRQHLFVVIDEYGGLAGVVALEDVLEEIIGQEIVDETDVVVDMRELAHRRRRQAMGDIDKQ